MPENAGFWNRTKQYSNNAYEKTLKPGFNKAYAFVDKLEPHVNRWSNKVGSEAFWPTTLDKESDKAARILRSFCKDGFYDHIDAETAKKAEDSGADTTSQVNVPQGKQRVVKKIPASVIQKAKALVIFTSMRTGWIIGGSGGAGVIIARHPDTGEWSPPSGIHMQNLSVGFLIGVDILDTVLVVNTYEALEAFMKVRCTLGTEVGLAAGPVGIGGLLESQVNKKPSPVWSYVKSRGFYGGVAVDGNVVIERTDENERFYGEPVGVGQILRGEIRNPPASEYKMLMDTVRAAQGENVDESLLPAGPAPSDMELIEQGPMFGVPSEDDPDPYGVKALEAEGLSIREAGTHRKASREVFEFKPSPSSPIFSNYRKSLDVNSLKKAEWRSSTNSLASVTRGTQTDDDDSKTSTRNHSPNKDTNSISSSRGLGISESPIQKATEPIKSSLANGDLDTTKSLNDKRKSDSMDSTHKHDDEHDDTDDYLDIESDVEIVTAVPATAKPRPGVVDVPKRIAPALPPRNPDRLSVRTPTSEDTMANGFEQISLKDDTNQKDIGESKVDGQAQTNTIPSNTISTVHTNDDQFHSMPTTPMEDKKV